jgi:hypothetical protein
MIISIHRVSQNIDHGTPDDEEGGEVFTSIDFE